jgi:hypothetical protein
MLSHEKALFYSYAKFSIKHKKSPDADADRGFFYVL